VKTCAKCRFWSEMCAQSIGCGPMEALCLKEGGPKCSRMTTESSSCPEWASSHHGAVDDPSGRWRKYAEEDTANAEAHGRAVARTVQPLVGNSKSRET